MLKIESKTTYTVEVAGELVDSYMRGLTNAVHNVSRVHEWHARCADSVGRREDVHSLECALRQVESARDFFAQIVVAKIPPERTPEEASE